MPDARAKGARDHLVLRRQFSRSGMHLCDSFAAESGPHSLAQRRTPRLRSVMLSIAVHALNESKDGLDTIATLFGTFSGCCGLIKAELVSLQLVQLMI